MSHPTPTKKRLQTRHADDAIRMAERLPGVMFDILYFRLGLDGNASTTKQIAEALDLSSIEVNHQYQRAIDLLATAVDSEEVAPEDIPDLLTVGWMRRDDDEPARPDPGSRQAIDRVLGGGVGGLIFTSGEPPAPPAPTPEEVISGVEEASHDVSEDVVSGVKSARA